jgi:hypothetical protein
VAGGGYNGCAAELDAVVAEAARALAAASGQDVEIRFNSDRESGGAFLCTPDGRNSDVGVCASLVTARPRERGESRARRHEAEAAGTLRMLTGEQRAGARGNAAIVRRSLADYPEGLLTYTRTSAAERSRTRTTPPPWCGWAGGMTRGPPITRPGTTTARPGQFPGALARCLHFAPARVSTDAR